MSDIEGEVARVATRERGQRPSFKSVDDFSSAQAARPLAVPKRFADRAFAFNASVSRSRGGEFVTSDSSK